MPIQPCLHHRVSWTRRTQAITVALVMSADLAPRAQQPTSLLRDQDCGPAQTLIAELVAIRVYATCSTATDGRLVSFVVDNTSDLLLRDFSIGFCGEPVIGVASPRGWRSESTGGKVRWIATNETIDAVQYGKNIIAGFAATLKPGWQLSAAVRVGWVNENGTSGGGGGVSAITHGCDDSAAWISRIRDAEPQRFENVRDAKDWRNPYLVIHRDGIEVITGQLPSGRQVVPVSYLERILVGLPLAAWPYGRVVALQQIGIRAADNSDATSIDENFKRAVVILNKLDITISRWP